ncbi:MAG: tRNA (adenosine(37)-N6)-threonylcarbamoyltransferase complex ATPase subunit type 1 TsaE [Sulfurovum sp.]|nr:tRNA (adenosine(37)-N6)-threonylcarbamoyltransferase complex ATPase subunit type 1 TsaE [Sulfurovum sp.]MDD3602559.1 tRNA (adenosine(37)-N6)-threonylcarbamoyltransferase complex ATPase subunit type 1 TsaE [Sulfurovum sp.]
MKEIKASLDQLKTVVGFLEAHLPQNCIVFLHGDLAAGKTTLTQAIAKSRGVEEEVTSPTFSLQHCYGKNLYHYDLYRLDYETFMQMGLLEEFEKEGWHIVEWGSEALWNFLKSVGFETASVSIKPDNESRIYRIEI